MRNTFAALVALLISAGILLAGGGLLGTLIAVRANIEGISLPVIGILMSSYYAGFIAGCMLTPAMVARAGHIRAFAALAALTAASALIYAISVNIPIWIILRMVTGFCFAGLYMIVESWINEKSTNEMRGQVLSIYRIVDLAAMTIGQFLLTTADPSGFSLFSLVSILVCVSIVPIAMTKAIAPEPLSRAKLDIPKLMKVSSFAVIGSLIVGFTNGAFWAIGPVFVQQLGYDVSMVATFMSAAIVAGAIAQWPIGFLSDIVDRRQVLIWTAAAAAASSFFLSQVGATSALMMLAGAALYGAFSMSIFGLSAAHANDHADADEFVSVTSGLLLVYGLGSIAGPILAPAVMGVLGPSALFIYTGAGHLSLFVFGLYRVMRRANVPSEEQGDYVLVPKTSPAIFEIDPRGDTDSQEEAVAESA